MTFHVLSVVLCLVVVVYADKPVRNLRVSFGNDKDYKISGVSTVGELQLRIQRKTGIDPLQQGRIMFNDKTLSPLDSLRDVGVRSGSRLYVQPVSVETSNTATTSNERWMRLMEFATEHLSQLEFRMSVDYLWDVLKALQRIVNSQEFQQYMADPKELLQIAEDFRSKLMKEPRIQELEEFPMDSSFRDQFIKALKSSSLWQSYFLTQVERFRTFDLNSQLMSHFKEEFGKVFNEGMENLNDPEFRDFLKEEDPDFYDFLQENLDDFSDNE